MRFLAFVWFLVLATAATGQADASFFADTDAFLAKHVKNTLIDYQAASNDRALTSLIERIGQADIDTENINTKQAFYINAYNLLVIDAASKAYPTKSVLEVKGFFDSRKFKVAGDMITLNTLEKERLFGLKQDPRFHFVLVCGALGCPPIANFAYTPDQLENQLEVRTRLALNNPNFIRVANGKASLSKIFQWYAKDFGGSKEEMISFINQYRSQKIPASYQVEYYEYDWTLNDVSIGSSGYIKKQGSSSNRYVVSKALKKGVTEIKWFNNLYTQRIGENRSSFLTSSLSVVFGVTSRFNLGIDARYRFVKNEVLPASPFEVLSFRDAPNARHGLTAFGPKVRFAPFRKLTNLSIQSAFWFPIGEDLQGQGDQLYIDWDGTTWWTQIFNDVTLSHNLSLFTEIDFLWEDMGDENNGHINRVSTPVTGILSYFPNPKTTLYALLNISPYWRPSLDYFAQVGAGFKYQFHSNLEAELLYTYFTNDFILEQNGNAATYNFGLRFNI